MLGLAVRVRGSVHRYDLRTNVQAVTGFHHAFTDMQLTAMLPQLRTMNPSRDHFPFRASEAEHPDIAQPLI